MNEKELCQLFERLQMCVDQLRVMQNVQEKEHHNLYRSILKLDKQVGYLVSQLAAIRKAAGGAPPKRGKKRSSGDKKPTGSPGTGEEVSEEKRPSTGEEFSSNETDSSHAEAGGAKKSGRRERRQRRNRRPKKLSDNKPQSAGTGLTDDLLEVTWAGPRVATFSEMSLKPDLVTGIQASTSGASEPSLFQQVALPALLEDNDTVVQSSGDVDEGKVVAIALAVLNKVNPQARACQALVLTSSREAAKQLHREMVALATFIRPRLTCHLSVGGTSIRDDVRDMGAGCHLVVGTLGRAFDMLRRGALRATDLRLVVLDDVDTMMTRRFDKDHIYAVLGELTAESREKIQLQLFLRQMHEDIPKTLSLYARSPITQVLVQAPSTESNEQPDVQDQLPAGAKTNGQLEQAVLKLAEKLGEVSLPESTVHEVVQN